jgi:hypothetical protein
MNLTNPASSPPPNAIEGPSQPSVRKDVARVSDEEGPPEEGAAPSAPAALTTLVEEEQYGWEIFPPDEDGVRRGGIKLGQLRVWTVPRGQIAQVTQTEFGGELSHPGLYILLSNASRRAYVGESHDLGGRLVGHSKSPPKEQGQFDFAVILNDGRNSEQSLFNDHTLRLKLEQHVVQLLTDQSDWVVANKVKSSPPLTLFQKSLSRALGGEVAFVLYQLRYVKSLPKRLGPALKVPPTELGSTFAGRVLTEIKEKEGRIDGVPIYFRPGGDKSKVGSPSNWQVTIPAGERLGIGLLAGQGYLCFNRGPVYLIPLTKLKTWLTPQLGLHKYDVFFDLEHDILTSGNLPKVSPLPIGQFKAVNLSKGTTDDAGRGGE